MELSFAGPNQNVTTSDLLTIGSLEKLEVLNVSRQVAFTDNVLFSIGQNCLNLRELFCEACYSITDAGLQCLSTCTSLSHVDISYCHLLSDKGLITLAENGRLVSLVARGCQALTDKSLCLLAHKCTSLTKLDICGCLSATNAVVFAFQESVLHMREHEKPITFTMLAGGTDIDWEILRQFGMATGAHVSLHDLSVQSLLPNYDPLMDIPPFTETWDTEIEEEGLQSATTVFPGSALDCVPGSGTAEEYDFLVADDPALYSDEFSGPESWGFS